MDNRKRIQQASRRLRYTMAALIGIVPVINGAVWLAMNILPKGFPDTMLPGYVSLPLPLSGRLLAFAASMIPTGVAMAGIYYLMRLFQLYEQGDIFKLSNVRCFGKLSRVLLLWFAAGIVHQPLLSIALTLHNPPGHRMLTIGFGSPDLTALLLGLILAVIAWVMEEGRKLQEEQELTV